VDGWPLAFCDTAGLRQSEHPLEQAGIERAQEQLVVADLVLLVFDLSHSWSDSDESLRRRFPTALIVHNKSDLAAAGSRPAGIAVSASIGAAIPQLLESVVERLVPQPPPPGAAVPFTNALVRQLETALEALAVDDWAHALEVLEGH